MDISYNLENHNEAVSQSNSQHFNNTFEVSGNPYCPDPERIKLPFVHFTKVRNQFLAIRSLPLSPSIKDQLKSHSFNNWLYSDSELINFTKFMFLDLNLPDLCHFSVDILENWLFSVYSRYNNVPFHNFKHAFMVTQMMYCIIKTINLQLYLSPVNLLILLFSAVSHDLDHPGFTNSYQVNSGSWLALRYNDISPLENHHCVTAFEIISNPTTNITSGLTRLESRHFRRSVIRCILSTDMAIHADCISQFQNLRQQIYLISPQSSIQNNDNSVNHHNAADHQHHSVFPSPQLVSFTPLPVAAHPPSTSCGLTSHWENQVIQHNNVSESEQQEQKHIMKEEYEQHINIKDDDSCIRSLLNVLINEQPEYLLRFLMILLKICDVSNETRPPSVADAWSDCLFNEFFMQADAEKRSGLPVAVYMDPDCVVKSSSQLNFLHSVLIPLLKELVCIFRELDVLLQAAFSREKHFSQMRQHELAQQEINSDSLTLTAAKVSMTPVIPDSLTDNIISGCIQTNSEADHPCSAQSLLCSDEILSKSNEYPEQKEQYGSTIVHTDHSYHSSNTLCCASSPVRCQQPQTARYATVESHDSPRNVPTANQSSPSSIPSVIKHNEQQQKRRDFLL
ncbi:unnamed protein product [Heterobilharzia americana]|nr:unnamed protein product [Heterobilharzia americana]